MAKGKLDPVTEARRNIVLGFLTVILLGALLLMLPISQANGKITSFLDALFTSTSAVCVTGLVVKDTGTYFSTLGQFIILLLIHIGGLGYVTMMTLIYLARGEQVGLRQKISVAVQLNKPDFSGVTNLLVFSLKVSLTFELIGAILLSIRFIPQMGPIKGIWASIFHSISAFNNAGFDIMGGFKSLTDYVNDPLINITIMLLIIAGGLGFIVWEELLEYTKSFIQGMKGEGRKMKITDLSIHTRIVLSTTAVLIIIPAILILIFEWLNPDTIGNLPLSGKILASLFQAVTPRTAGFATLDMAKMMMPSILLITFLMFVGGSPGGTAGGIKTTTFVVVLEYLKSFMQNKRSIILRSRRLAEDTIKLALAIFIIQFITVSMSIFFLSIVMPNAPFEDIVFEAFSAIGTVGLSRGLTTQLNDLGKIIIIITMFLGRVGTISVLAGYIYTPKKELYTLPEDDIAVS